MKVIGLIAEYNPFHLGHLYQINKIKEMYPDSIIIVVISPTITQRGDFSIINKWAKTEICLNNKIDIVIELPTVFAFQSADIFAKGALQILNTMHIDTLVFGTEEIDLKKIQEVATMQDSDDCKKLIKKNLSLGMNYPTALSNALKTFLNYQINNPNDLLAVSYLKEINQKKYHIETINIPRTTSYHGQDIVENITNASNIRQMFEQGENVTRYLPPYNINYLKNINRNDFFPYLKYQIISNINLLNTFQTVDEGIENRIKKYINNANNWEELVQSIKTKRYTYNKINRMLCHILTTFTKEMGKSINPDYIRILGFNKTGQKYLNHIKKNIAVPIITNYQKNISEVLDFELKVASIYSLVTKDNILIDEFEHKPIIKDT